MQISNDPSNGSNLHIDKVRYSLDPEDSDFRWNRVDDPDTRANESYFPRYSLDHSPADPVINLGDDNDPFRRRKPQIETIVFER